MGNGDLVRQLSGTLFWDVDAEKVDERTHRDFIISRAMDRGSRNDAYAVWRHYGSEAVRDALLRAPSLLRRTVFFFANQFRLRPEDFRAYRKSQALGTWIH